MINMHEAQISETFYKGQADGRELYQTVSIAKKILIGVIATLGLLSMIASFVALNSVGIGGFMLVLFVAIITLGILYAVVVIGLNSAQVLVHLLNSNLAVLSYLIQFKSDAGDILIQKSDGSFSKSHESKPETQTGADKITRGDSVHTDEYKTQLLEKYQIGERVLGTYKYGNKLYSKLDDLIAVLILKEKDIFFSFETLDDAIEYCDQLGYSLSNEANKFTIKARGLTHFLYSENEVINWCKHDFENLIPTPQQPS